MLVLAIVAATLALGLWVALWVRPDRPKGPPLEGRGCSARPEVTSRRSSSDSMVCVAS